MPSHSNDHWPCRYVCWLLAGCILGYRCRSLWIQRLYQSHFVDHLQELWGQNHSWCLQEGYRYNFSMQCKLKGMQVYTCTIMQVNPHTYYTCTKPHTCRCMYIYTWTIHTNTDMVHMSTCICMYIRTNYSGLVNTRVVYLLLATMYYQTVDLLSHLTYQLKPAQIL